MEQFLLLVMLAVGTHGLFQVPETECDATQTTSPCAPTLGGSVEIKLMANATGYMLQCYKNTTSKRVNVFSLKKGVVKIEEAYLNRTEFFISTGTLKITNVKKNDTGQYIMTVHNSEGEHKKDTVFFLEVREASSFYLILICVAAGALLALALCCCLCWKLKCCRKSGQH